MIGTTLFRYFLRKQLATFGWLLLGVVAMVVLIDFTETVSRLSGISGFGFGRALLIVALHVPPILEQVLPFAVLLASIITLVRLNRKSELVVARSAGLSAWQFLAPLCVGAFAIGLVSLMTLNPLAALTLRWEENLQFSLIGDGDVSAQDGPMLWLRHSDGEGSIIISAADASDGGTALHDATVYRVNANDDLRERYDADLLRLDGGAWVIADGVRKAIGTASERVRNVRIPTPVTAEAVRQRTTVPEATAFHELFTRIAVLERLGLPTEPFRMQVHALLTRPVLFVAMALIAGTMTLRFTRSGRGRGVLIGGLAAAFVLYVATVLVRAFGAAGLVPPVAAAWAPVLAALLFGATVLLRTEDG